MSWSWISKIIEKKIIDEAGKQLNVKVTKDGKIELKSQKICKFCKALVLKEETFCPKCRRSFK